MLSITIFPASYTYIIDPILMSNLFYQFSLLQPLFFEKCNNIAKIYMPLTIIIVYREKRDKNK